MSRKIPTPKGTQVNHYTLLEDAPHKTARVRVRCKCGREYKRSVTHMENNPQCHSCAAVMRNTTHGGRQTPLYRIWCAMIQRCYNPNASKYKYYGGRGVTVCDRWRYSFENFEADMGDRPKGYQLDKDILSPYKSGMIYCPEYCQWVTKRDNTAYAWGRPIQMDTALSYTFYTNIL